ncbi:methyl-accepting chemotaxis protein [Nocardioides caricicola]|uniref:Methyl-accepting chemotaxis protein n=1 Tax=Nocardioides caricicola TaxID=634770 RepID=A0ABW0MXR3_9ACTN
MIRRSAAPGTDHDAYAAAFAELLRVCNAAAEGDLEVRVANVPGTEHLADVLDVRRAVNKMLDRTDGYVRESSASLQAAAEGRFHRRFLLAGTTGVFRSGAEAINGATDAMAEAQSDLEAAAARRCQLAERLEQTVGAVAEQMAAAASELSATSSGLADAAHRAGTEAETAGAAVREVRDAAQQIHEVVQVISAIAKQTRLLALNATIEAARAGDAGLGFAVVASEVKSLADSTADSTERITRQVDTMQEVAGASGAAMSSVEATVEEMSPMVDAVTIAVDGVHDPTIDSQGLAEMAERLRVEVTDLLAEMREG